MRILRTLFAPRRNFDLKAPARPWFLFCLPRLALAGACSVLAFAAHAACPPSAIASLGKPGSAVGQWNAVDRGLLWRAERNGRTSWLYGTIHLGRAEWVRPGPTVQKALEQSDALALELDMRDPATLRSMTQPADPALVARLLNGQRAQRLARQNEEACVPPGTMAGLQPILQVTALAGLVARADGLYPEFGVDETLAVSARNNSKPVFALESAASQLKMLTGESEAEEAEQIDAALDELESGQMRAQMKELADVWARGDVDKLGRYPEWCNCVNTPAERRLMKRLLDDRNPGLADGIERMHVGGQRVFAAVGALHMVGSQGLPALMAARGFTVTAVPLAVQPPLAVPAAPSPKAEARNARGARSARDSRGARSSQAAKSSSAKGSKGSAKPAQRTPAPKSKQRR